MKSNPYRAILAAAPGQIRRCEVEFHPSGMGVNTASGGGAKPSVVIFEDRSGHRIEAVVNEL